MIGKLQKDNKGFTIIEVLIVLAIAGLIMLIVFLAVPALQRNQRNNARNSEASRISSAVTECLANRNGVQTSCQSAVNLAIGTSNTALTGYQQFTSVSFNAAGTGGTTTNVNIAFGRKCLPDGSGTITTDATQRDFTVTYQREPAINRCIGSESN